MYTAIVLVVFAFFAAATAEIDKCMRIGFHNRHCCKKPSFSKNESNFLSIKECFKPPLKPHSCELSICIGKKLGFANDDGTYDKSILEAQIKKFFEDDPDLVKVIKEQCIDGDISKYGSSESCDLNKIRKCVHFQAALKCPEWDNEGHCKGMKELVAECSNKFK